MRLWRNNKSSQGELSQFCLYYDIYAFTYVQQFHWVYSKLF